MATLYLSLGTNLGDRRFNLETACTLIGQRIGIVQAVSEIIETKPWGFDSPNRFLNMVAKVETSLQPLDVLHITQEIERSLGRTEKTINGEYQDRLIDIDLLMYDNVTMSTPELTLPHPRMKERKFVMEPLLQIAPQLKTI